MKLITLTNGTFAQVDDEDFERISENNWYDKGGVVNRNKRINGRLTVIPLAAEVMGFVAYMYDHKDRNYRNNQKYNLRPCDELGNSRNCSKTKGWTTSKYKGVYWQEERKRWHASIRIADGKKKFLGRFVEELEAAKAYDKAALEHHGEFASINFP